MKTESTFPYSFLLLVSLAVKWATLDSREVAASCWVLLCGLSRQKDLYYSRRKERKRHKHTYLHTHSSLTSFKCTKKQRAKNDFGSERRTPLAYSSCFTVRFACITRRVAVAMSRRFSPRSQAGARSPCQTPSASQLQCCSNSYSETQRKTGQTCLLLLLLQLQ